jgi:hypothetical protein
MEKFKQLYFELLESYLDAVQRDVNFDISTLAELKEEWIGKFNKIEN